MIVMLNDDYDDEGMVVVVTQTINVDMMLHILVEDDEGHIVEQNDEIDINEYSFLDTLQLVDILLADELVIHVETIRYIALQVIEL